MPNPNDPALEQQKKALAKEIADLDREIDDAPVDQDTTELEAELARKQGEMRELQLHRKQARAQALEQQKKG